MTTTMLRKANAGEGLFARLSLLIALAMICTAALVQAQSVASGGDHTLLLKNNGTVWTCGYNNKGQLGDGTTTNHTAPAQIAGLTGIVAVAAKSSTSLFLKNDGTVWGCGYNAQGQLGNNSTTDALAPVQVQGLATHSITAISTGGFHSLFLESDGHVWATGYNLYGALGRGDNVDLHQAEPVSGISGVIAIAAGELFSVFLKSNGTVWVCGYNSNGQLGLGTFFDINVPTEITSLSDITAISAGLNHILFLKSDGTVKSCGVNGYGRLGTGSSSASSVPVDVINVSDITRISAGHVHSLFLKNNGTAYACGDGFYGPLGDGTTNVRYSPVAVSTSGGIGTITNMSAGDRHSWFQDNSCQAWATGSNEYGQIADATEPFLRYVPTLEFNLCSAPVCDVNVSNFFLPFATSPCLYNSSSVTISSSTLAPGTYTANYTLSGAAGNNSTVTSLPFTFSGGTGTFLVDQSVLPNIGSTTVSVNYVTTSSCNSATMTTGNSTNFTVRSVPYFTAIGNNGPVCTGNTLSLSSTVSGGNGVYTYSWSGPSAFTSTLRNPTVTTNAAVGNAGVYSLTATDGFGCVSSRTVTSVSVTGITPITGITTVATSSTTTLSNATGGGVWSAANTTIATVSAAGVVTGVAPGNTAVFYTLGGACTATVTVTVTGSVCDINVSNFSVLSATSPCLHGASLVSINSSTMAPGTYTANYTLSGASGNSATATSAPFVFASGAGSFSIDQSVLTNTGATTVAVNYIAIASCHSATLFAGNSANFNVNELPVISAIGNNGPVCVGSILALNSAATGGSGVYGYSWAGPMGYSAAVASPTVTPNAAAASAGAYVLTVTDGNICVTTATTTATVTTVAPITGTLTVGIGSTTLLHNATNSGIWSVSNTDIATVTTGGLVTGVTPGSTVVNYTLPGGCMATATITVIVPGAMNNVCVGQQVTLPNGGMPGGTWLSGNGSIATVSASGVVGGVGAGTVLIYYFPPAGTMVTNSVTVKALSPSNMPTSICEGRTTTAANATPGGGVWSSSNTSVAIADASGVITGTGAGTATISFTAGNGCVAGKTLTVLPGARVSGPAAVCVGQTIQLSSTATGGAWQSSNGSIAAVNASGAVTGVGVGTVVIRYTLGTGCDGSRTITVNALSPIVMPASICQGPPAPVSNATPGGGIWSSSNTDVAAVIGTGFLYPGIPGTAVISFVSTTGCITQKTVTVLATAELSGSTSVCKGQSIQLSASIAGGTWESGNASRASVSPSGLVTGLSAGPVILWYRVASCYATYGLTVDPLSPTNIAESICQGSSSAASNITPGGGIWSSSNSAVATISATGVIGSGAAGTTVITFETPAGCMTQNTLTVKPEPQVSGPGIVCVGQTIQLSSSITSGGNWVSTSGTLASVSSAGLVTGLSAGSVFIGYDIDGCADVISVSVRALSPTNLVAGACQGQTVTATNYTPGGGIWSSSNTVVAPINASGIITASAPGTSVISFVTASGCITQKTFSVSASAQISGGNSVCAGQSLQLSSGIAVAGVWYTTNNSVATVSPSTGLVTGVGAGTVYIGYATSECASSTTISVKPLSPIVMSATTCQGNTLYPTNATAGGGIWSSGNTTVATATSAGTITPVAPGTATIYFVSTTGCIAQKDLEVITSPQISGGSSVCVGQSVQLSTSIPGGTWMSGSVRATISPTGLVTGVSPGLAPIYYTTATCATGYAVTVNALFPIVMPASICQGEVNGATNATPGGGMWSSSNSSVATISGLGTISGLSPGTTVISFVSGAGCATQKTLSVLPSPVVSGSNRVCVGQTTQLSSTITSGGAWSSLNPARGAVSSTGLVTGMSVGPVLIGYTIGGCSAAITMTVNALSPINSAATVCAGQTITATNASAGGGAWSSGNTTIAGVNTAGVISGVSAGIAAISFTTTNGCVATRTVTVSGGTPITGFPVVCQGQRAYLSNSTPGGNWSSSNGALAGVTSTGVVTGVAAGSPVIYYVLPSTGCWSSVTMTVRPLSQTTGGTSSMCQSGTMTLANATLGGGIWSSSNTAIATVSAAGVVRGQGPGVAIISFTTAFGCVQSRTVTVNPCREAQGEGLSQVADVDNTVTNLNLFPNPNQGAFTLAGEISFTGEEVTAEVINLLGQVVYRGAISITNGAIDYKLSLADNAANGSYMLRLSADGFNKVLRFTVNR